MFSNIFLVLLFVKTVISEWVLTFEDDFTGTTLNESSWTISNYSSIISQYDGHDALFVTEAITVRDGSLQITTTYNPQVFDSASFPSRDWSPNWPIIDFSADFHTFGVEINSTALRFYVDNYTSFTKFYPTLCVTDPLFLENGGWGHSGYMPFKPLYSILNVAVTPNANTSWWLQNHQTTTLVDWVKWYEYQ